MAVVPLESTVACVVCSFASRSGHVASAYIICFFGTAVYCFCSLCDFVDGSLRNLGFSGGFDVSFAVQFNAGLTYAQLDGLGCGNADVAFPVSGIAVACLVLSW